MMTKTITVAACLPLALLAISSPVMADDNDPLDTVWDILKPNPGQCNGDVDYACTCVDSSNGCIQGETCGLYVNRHCYVG